MHILGQALLGALDCWPPEPPLFRIFNVEESISCMPGLATKQENFKFLRNQVTHECLLKADSANESKNLCRELEAIKLQIDMQCPAIIRIQALKMTGTLPYLHSMCQNQ